MKLFIATIVALFAISASAADVAKPAVTTTAPAAPVVAKEEAKKPTTKSSAKKDTKASTPATAPAASK